MRSLFRTLLLGAIVASTSSFDLTAQSSLPNGPDNIGTDFWLAFPANWDYTAPSKYVRLYITSDVATEVKVWAGTTLVRTLTTVPHNIVTVDLTLAQAQMFTRDDTAPVPDDQIYPGRAVHIEAEDPIVVYGINRISYTSDGLLGLPTSGLGTDYVVASAADIASGSTAQKLPSQFMVIAPFDSTVVTINQSWESHGHTAGQPYTVTLNKGDVYSVMSKGIGGDLSGTTISATRPVTVTAGQNCTYLPNAQYPACDHICETMLPTSTWGTVYYSMPYAQRLKGDLYRIYGSQPNTKLYINGVHFATLPSSGGVKGEGWVEYLPPSREPIVFSADKPISVAQYNNSSQYDGVQTDPFYLMLTPVDQFGSNAVISTPSSDYPQNYLNVISDSASYSQLEFAPAGTEDWMSVGALSATTGFKEFSIMYGGARYGGVTLQVAPGAYKLRSPGKFAAYIYGYSNFDSYGYPASAVTADLTTGDSTAPIVSSQEGNASMGVTVRDEEAGSSGLAEVTLVTGTRNFMVSSSTLRPGIDHTAFLTLMPIDRSKPAVAVIVATDMAGNRHVDTVTQMPISTPSLTVYSLDFGVVHENEQRVLTTQLVNDGSAPVVITEATIRPGPIPFTLGPLAYPLTIPVGGVFSVEVRFLSAAIGSFAATLEVRDSAGNVYTGELRAVVIDGQTEGVRDGATSDGALWLSIAPNPAAGSSVALDYTIASIADVSATLYTLDGREVKRLFAENNVAAGSHRKALSLDGIPSGSYVCRLTAGGKTVSQSLVIAR